MCQLFVWQYLGGTGGRHIKLSSKKQQHQGLEHEAKRDRCLNGTSVAESKSRHTFQLLHVQGVRSVTCRVLYLLHEGRPEQVTRSNATGLVRNAQVPIHNGPILAS